MSQSLSIAAGRKRPRSPSPCSSSKSSSSLEFTLSSGSSKDQDDEDEDEDDDEEEEGGSCTAATDDSVSVGQAEDEEAMFVGMADTKGVTTGGIKVLKNRQQNETTLLCLVGRGRVRCRRRRRRGGGGGVFGAVVQIHGYTLPPDDEWRIFESPEWTSSITVCIGPGARVEVQSLWEHNDARPTAPNGGGAGGGDDYHDLEPQRAQRENGPERRRQRRRQLPRLSAVGRRRSHSFRVANANHRRVRATVVPTSWQRAADAILKDYWETTPTNKEKGESQLFRPSSPRKPVDRRNSPSCHRTSGVTKEGEEEEDGMQQQRPSLAQPGQSVEERRFVVVVAGAKGVGKSTCVRYLVNRFLSSSPSIRNDDGDRDGPFCRQEPGHERERVVAVLDADAGQPEFSPPGILSLATVREPLWKQPHHHLVCDGQREGGGGGGRARATGAPVERRRAFFLGSATAQGDPERYLATVQALLDAYHDMVSRDRCLGGGENGGKDGDHRRAMPLVVNLDGWVKGLGMQVLQAILSRLRPDHVVSVLGDLKSKIFDLTGAGAVPDGTELHAAQAYNSRANAVVCQQQQYGPQQQQQEEQQEEDLWIVSPSIVAASTETAAAMPPPPATPHRDRPPSACFIPAVALRALRLTTYFLGTDPTVAYPTSVRFGRAGLEDPDCLIANALAAARPYAVAWERVGYRLLGHDRGQEYDDVRSHEALLAALNGSIVGLCVVSAAAEGSLHCLPEDTDGRPVPCVGLGIVRSIDRVRQIFYLLTPVDPTELRSVNLLCRGDLALPLECHFRGVRAEAFPYQSFEDGGGRSTAEATPLPGARPMRSRNSLARAGTTASEIA